MPEKFMANSNFCIFELVMCTYSHGCLVFEIQVMCCKYNNPNIHRYPDIQMSKCQYIQVYIDPLLQLSKYPNIQISRCPDIQVSRYPNIQICKYLYIQISRNLIIQKSRYSGLQTGHISCQKTIS